MFRFTFDVIRSALVFIFMIIVMVIIGTKIYGVISGNTNRGVFIYNVYTDSMNHGGRISSYKKGGFVSGDAIIVASKKPISEKDGDIYYKVKPGDVISYYPDSSNKNVILTHRLVDIVQDDQTGDFIFYTQGDANNAVDTGISEDQIIGSYLFPIPFFGYFISFFDQLKNNLLFIAIID